ncbi:MAG: hypothetical protein IPK19_19275 [Chloroflexi bacterium]|nr:hypothetical protein [Chloroflexota bacterium]
MAAHARVEFYDVKTRQKVLVDEKDVVRATFKRKDGRVLYGLSAQLEDGRFLTRYVTKEEWDQVKEPARKN